MAFDYDANHDYDADTPDEVYDAFKHERQVLGVSAEAQTRELLQAAAPGAASEIINLAQEANNENTRLKAAQYLVDRVLDQQDDGQGPLENMLQDLVDDAEKLANSGS